MTKFSEYQILGSAIAVSGEDGYHMQRTAGCNHRCPLLACVHVIESQVPSSYNPHFYPPIN